MIRRTASKLATLIAPLVVTASLHAGVITVDDNGPADYSQINAAVSNSNDGDTILVKSGTYAPVPILGRVVNIVADAGAVVNIDGYVAVVGLPAGKSVLLSGLNATAALDTHFGLFLEDNLGAIRVQDCRFEGFSPADGWDGASQDLQPGGAAIYIQNSRDVSIARTTAIGGTGQSAGSFFTLTYSGAGGAGINTLSSKLSLHTVFVAGGWSGVSDYGGRGGDGVRLDSTELYVADSTIAGGSGGPIMDIIPLCHGGGDGIQSGASSLTRTLDVAVSRGLASLFAGQPGSCADGVTFAGSGTYVHLTPSARSFHATEVVREGNSAQLTFSGVPGDEVYLASARVLCQTYVQVTSGTWLLRYPARLRTTSIGTIGASGTLVTNIPVGSVDVSVGARGVSLQALHVGAAGELVVGPPCQITVLDSSF